MTRTRRMRMLLARGCGCAAIVAALARASDARAQTAHAEPAANAAWTVTGAFAALSVRDAPAVAQWYREKLGFQALTEGTAPNGTRFALLRQGDSLLEIIEPPAGQQVAPAVADRRQAWRAPGIAKLGFTVADLDGLERRLRAAGVTFNHGIVQPRDHPFRTFAIVDPEGNTIQFFGR